MEGSSDETDNIYGIQNAEENAANKTEKTKD